MLLRSPQFIIAKPKHPKKVDSEATPDEIINEEILVEPIQRKSTRGKQTGTATTASKPKRKTKLNVPPPSPRLTRRANGISTPNRLAVGPVNLYESLTRESTSPAARKRRSLEDSVESAPVVSAPDEKPAKKRGREKKLTAKKPKKVTANDVDAVQTNEPSEIVPKRTKRKAEEQTVETVAEPPPKKSKKKAKKIAEDTNHRPSLDASDKSILTEILAMDLDAPNDSNIAVESAVELIAARKQLVIYSPRRDKGKFRFVNDHQIRLTKKMIAKAIGNPNSGVLEKMHENGMVHNANERLIYNSREGTEVDLDEAAAKGHDMLKVLSKRRPSQFIMAQVV